MKVPHDALGVGDASVADAWNQPREWGEWLPHYGARVPGHSRRARVSSRGVSCREREGQAGANSAKRAPVAAEIHLDRLRARERIVAGVNICHLYALVLLHAGRPRRLTSTLHLSLFRDPTLSTARPSRAPPRRGSSRQAMVVGRPWAPWMSVLVGLGALVCCACDGHALCPSSPAHCAPLDPRRAHALTLSRWCAVQPSRAATCYAEVS